MQKSNQQNFWQTLPKPFLVLAPMEEVTDVVFRQVVAKCGKPDVFFTEFTSTDGLLSPGHDKVAHRLQTSDVDQPIVAQIWGNHPEKFKQAAQMVAKMGFAGIDINMGCPVKKITKQGGCSNLINHKDLAKEIILATIEGAGNLPVSVKTRCGFNNWQTEEWASVLLSTPIAALTMHGRIAKELSKFPAKWDEIAKVVQLRDELNPNCLIIGNGDVKSREEAEEKCKTYGIDGVMIGRGIFENPWLFNPDQRERSIEEKLDLLLYHTKLFEQTWGKNKNFMILRRFFKIYCKDFDGAAELRAQLMETKSYAETAVIVNFYCESINSNIT